MRYADFIKKGERLGFIAPSFGISTEPYISLFDRTLEFFEKEGYKTVLGPNVRAGEGIGKSNTPEKCGAEINDFFVNDRCDLIVSCGGGETMCEDLPYVDFESIRNARPKWYMGYSDNTNLTYTLPVLADTAAIYGSCACDFGMEKWHEATSDAYDVLTGKKLSFNNYNGWEKESLKSAENPLATYNITEPFRLRAFVGEKDVTGGELSFSGRLLGGCMDCLQVLCGTKFDRTGEFADRYKEDGIIWFLEACDLNVMSIRRVLWQFEQAGWFKNVKGFIIGRPMHYDDAWGSFDRIEAVTGILSKYNVPVVMDLDIGHLPPRMPIISGACADIRVKGNEFSIEHILK